MNTQSILYQNSAQIPEGFYLQLMNSIKIDFESEQVTKVIVLNRSIPRIVAMSKYELLQQIIKNSSLWTDREEILLKINRLTYHELKELTTSRNLPVMKENPRWVLQQSIIRNSGYNMAELRSTMFSPNIVNIPRQSN